MEIQSRASRRQSVVLVPSPFQGHVTPMLQLGSILHSQGLSVIIAHTEYNAPSHLNHPEFVFLPMDDGSQGLDMSFYNVLGYLYDINENCKIPFRNYLIRLMEEDELGHGDNLTCIIYDNVMFFVDDVATQLNLTTIVMRPFSACYLHALLTILQQPDTYFPTEEARLLDLVPELHPLRFKDLPLSVIDKLPEPVLQFCQASNDIKSAVATIWNSMEHLENTWLLRLQEHNKVPFFAIGPFHKMAPPIGSTSLRDEDNSCIEWLDKQAPNSVLYVSLGSLSMVDNKELIETAWGLANSEQHFLWVVRPGSVSGTQWVESLPEGFEEMIGERGRIVKWVPQKQVLAHPAIAGFLTHCGWNSTLESILEGVPMICRPSFADQLVIARHMTQIYKVGLELEVMERKIIQNTIRKLMLSEEGKDVKKRVVDMKQKIVASMQTDGSSRTNLNNLVEFISSLPSRPAPEPAAVIQVMSANHIPSDSIIET